MEDADGFGEDNVAAPLDPDAYETPVAIVVAVPVEPGDPTDPGEPTDIGDTDAVGIDVVSAGCIFPIW